MNATIELSRKLVLYVLETHAFRDKTMADNC